MKKKVSIVGGGIVGILSALYLNEKDFEVTLIDSGSLGGLLNSYSINNISYDYGTHIPMSTGNGHVDRLLFEGLSEGNWEIFRELKVASFFEGSLNSNSVYPDIQLLDDGIFFKGTYELLQSSVVKHDLFESLEDFYSLKFGETIKEYVYKDIFLKLTGIELKKLHYKSSQLFDVNRVIVGPKDLTNNLKENSLFDNVIASNVYNTINSNKLMYYPKNNQGIGLWIKELHNKLIENNIMIKSNVMIEEVVKEEKILKKIKLSNDETIEIDYLVWTVAGELLNKLLNKANTLKKMFRSTVLINFNLDRDFLIDKHFVTCWDKRFKTFRVTMYPNLSVTLKQQNIFNCTVEVFMDNEYSFDEGLYETVFNELISMGILTNEHSILDKSYKFLKNSFPILTSEVFNDSKQTISNLTDSLDNIILCGRANIETFFMRDSLIDAIEKIDNLCRKG